MNHFDQHSMRRETGWTWRCNRPGTGTYGFRITFAPYSLMISGDIGDLIVNHYSFTDPWAAAAWVNGAGWDYFMEKAAASKEYDRDATAEFIVEQAYRQMRDGARGGMLTMQNIVEHFGASWEGDADTQAGRKYACREMLSSGVDQDVAYDITSDPEDLIHRYPERHRICYEAARWWATRMWETEPTWHKIVRLYRRALGEWHRLKTSPIVFEPIRYARFDDLGKPIMFNGARYWRWRIKGNHARYEGLAPLVMFGCDLTHLGLWRVQGSSWPDRDLVDQWGRPTVESQFREAV